MKLAIIYDTKTQTTAKAAEYIAQGAEAIEVIETGCFNITDADNDFVRSAEGIIMGSPTYMASVSHPMLAWLQTVAVKLGLAGKLGGAYATEQYIHGGAENAIAILLTHEMVYGMMVYSGGNSAGKPIIHLGPVGMSQDIEGFRELFFTYGNRFATQMKKLFRDE